MKVFNLIVGLASLLLFIGAVMLIAKVWGGIAACTFAGLVTGFGIGFVCGEAHEKQKGG